MKSATVVLFLMRTTILALFSLQLLRRMTMRMVVQYLQYYSVTVPPPFSSLLVTEHDVQPWPSFQSHQNYPHRPLLKDSLFYFIVVYFILFYCLILLSLCLCFLCPLQRESGGGSSVFVHTSRYTWHQKYKGYEPTLTKCRLIRIHLYFSS